MSKLRVFVSSTCYDFATLRSELRPFIEGMGYDPIMSEYSEVLYDPRTHTQDSCVKEVPNADAIVLIIGSRFGGQGIPSVVSQLDFSQLAEQSSSRSILENKENLSITQLEVLRAVQENIPIYAFVEDRVMHDHSLYERNKNKSDIIDYIEFPSIQRKETAKYIFEFINFLSHRVANNNITSFASLDDIRSHLAIQWSQLFQRLLMESRTKIREEKLYRGFSESLEDLKAVLLSSITTPDLRNIAKGAVLYRRLIDFVACFRVNDIRALLLSKIGWDELIGKVGVNQIVTPDARMGRRELLLVLPDRTFYRVLVPPRVYDAYRVQWAGFVQLDQHSREAIVDALLEDRAGGRLGWGVQYHPSSVDLYAEAKAAEAHSQPEAESTELSMSPFSSEAFLKGFAGGFEG